MPAPDTSTTLRQAGFTAPAFAGLDLSDVFRVTDRRAARELSSRYDPGAAADAHEQADENRDESHTAASGEVGALKAARSNARPPAPHPPPDARRRRGRSHSIHRES